MDRRGFLGRAAAFVAAAAAAKPQEALAEASAPAPVSARRAPPDLEYRAVVHCDACGRTAPGEHVLVQAGSPTGVATLSGVDGFLPRPTAPSIIEGRLCLACASRSVTAHYDERTSLLFFYVERVEKVADRPMYVYRIDAFRDGRALQGAFSVTHSRAVPRGGDLYRREVAFQREKKLQAIARAFNGREPVEVL